jgi:hypothetical protein
MTTLRDFQNQIAELQAKERENAKARALASIEKERERKPTKNKDKTKAQEVPSNDAASIRIQESVADNTGVDCRLQVSLFNNDCLVS